MEFVFCAVVALQVPCISPLFHVHVFVTFLDLSVIAWSFIHQDEENIQLCQSDVVSFPSLITQTLCIRSCNYLCCGSVLDLCKGLLGFSQMQKCVLPIGRTSDLLWPILLFI